MGRLKQCSITLVDLMAAVPSVVFGLWGVFFLQESIIPVSRWISTYFGWIPFFAVTDADGDPLDRCERLHVVGVHRGHRRRRSWSCRRRPRSCARRSRRRRWASARRRYALGSTRWGMIRAVVLPFGRGGIIGGTMLGLGRALGETIAVYMIISPIFTINWQVLKTGSNSVSALIALRYGEASEFALSALMAAGLVLFLITLVVNFTASSIVARSRSGAESEA